MRATVIITTKNRRDDLLRAVRSALIQTAAPEILVLDDGSSDGTSDALHAAFQNEPRLHVHTYSESQGYIARRNQAAHLASGDILFSIDDDAEFSSPHVVEQTLRDFDYPKIGAVAIPYREPHRGDRLLQTAPDSARCWVTDSFIGTAHALRKDLFLQLGGYRAQLIHQGEESDYCLRLLEAGYYVRLGRSDPILHWESPKRSLDRMDYYGARNALLFHWWNTPTLYLPVALPLTALRCALWSLQPHRFFLRLKALRDAFMAFHPKDRHPVSTKTYNLWRRLRNRKAITGAFK